MNRIFNAAKIFILCGILFIGGKASAAEVNAEAMEIFRETVMQTSKQDSRVFRQDIFFAMPQLSAGLEFLGSIKNDKLNLAGTFESWLLNDNGKVDHTEKPFYLAQDKQNMVIYFQDEKKKWNKMTAPIEAANLTDTFATPNPQQLEQMLEFVKDVSILQETDKKRILLVKIDGTKIAEYFKAEIEKNNAGKPVDEMTKTIFGYFDTGLKNSDMWYTWTVDKVNWQTVMMSFNLSSVVQNIALAALNDPSQTLTSLEPIKEILENLAFYSDLKAYSIFLNEDARANLEIPKKVLKAKEVKSFNEDSKKTK